MNNTRIVSIVMTITLLAAGLCGCAQAKASAPAESWAYIHEPDVEILRFNEDGTAVFNGAEYSSYTQDDEYITLTNDKGQSGRMLYEMGGDQMVLYQPKVYTFQGEGEPNGIIGVWQNGKSAFQFTDKGTYLEDNVFPGHYEVDEAKGTIKLMYNDPFEDTLIFFTLEGDKLTIQYPWPMVRTGSAKEPEKGTIR